MALSPFIIIIPVFAAILIILLLLSMRGRGQPIQCPECGHRFKRPTFSEKTIGVGPSIGKLGTYTCPKCGHKARASTFQRVDSLVDDEAK